VQEAAATAEAHIKSTEETVLEVVRTNVKQGMSLAQEYPYAAYSVGAVALLLFPGPRSFVSKHIFGVFQSQVCPHSAPTWLHNDLWVFPVDL
jgi:hypothetical protein